MKIEKLKNEIKSCSLCKSFFIHEPRPIFRFTNNSTMLIISQAPGIRVHKSGIPWTDRSGVRLRKWLNLTEDEFYNDEKISIMPMGLCYPGIDKLGGDLPPRKECAPKWHNKIMAFLPNIKLTLLVGSYAQKYYLGKNMKSNMTETVRCFEEYLPDYLPLPHPSWRNTSWINKNDWFDNLLIPNLQNIVRDVLCL